MIELQDRLDKKTWNEALSKFPPECRDVNLTPEFAEIQTADGRGEALCSYLREGDKQLLITGMGQDVPGTLASKTPGRFWDLQSSMGYGSIAASPQADPDFIERAWKLWSERRAKEGMVAAFFRLHPVVDDRKWLPAGAHVRAFRKLAYADLTQGLEHAWTHADPAHRRQVKKGQRANLQVQWDEPSAWNEFEGFYNEVMKKKNAWDDAFVSHEHFVLLRTLPGASLASVREGGKLVAAILFIFGPRFVHYHQSVRDDVLSPVYAHNCIVQSAIERAARMGLSGVLLGGGITRAIDDPLLVFKKRAGYVLVDYNIALLISNPAVYAELEEAWSAKAGERPTWLMSYRQPLPANT